MPERFGNPGPGERLPQPQPSRTGQGRRPHPPPGSGPRGAAQHPLLAKADPRNALQTAPRGSPPPPLGSSWTPAWVHGELNRDRDSFLSIRATANCAPTTPPRLGDSASCPRTPRPRPGRDRGLQKRPLPPPTSTFVSRHLPSHLGSPASPPSPPLRLRRALQTLSLLTEPTEPGPGGGRVPGAG